jgi:amino acid transporter
MIYALVITTILYILISLVLTGMIHYNELAVGDPLAYAFQKLHLTKLSGIIAISAVIAMASVLLVFQMGQPRIWMSMSRDGLLPKIFSRLHPKYKTPAFSTVITGIVVAVPSLFLNLTEVTDLTSIGTLFAFVLVSGGVLILDDTKGLTDPKYEKGTFRVPYLNSRIYLPLIWLGIFAVGYFWDPPELTAFMDHSAGAGQWIQGAFPIVLFSIAAVTLTIFALWKQWSLIPVLGLLTNFYLMAQLGITNWMRFIIWLIIGLAIYFMYSHKHSKLKMED